MEEFRREFDTIAAVSTPRGKGGVALIRISGSGAATVGDRVFRPRAGVPLSRRAPRTAVFGDIIMPGDALAVDSGLATLFRAPSSFTGEDTVEICCHGGVLVTRAVLAAALAAGARQAERGEFTRRAFAAGKLGLEEAEALGMLLDAGTDAQLRLSHGGMSGKLSEACAALRGEITVLLTDIYARTDFPDEDLGSIPPDEVVQRLARLRKRTEELCSTYRTGRAIADGVGCVICGRTNAGKSTLYNRLIGSDEAIVTDIEGTTRDILTATVDFGGVTLRLSDTAGIRGGISDTVEALGVGRARERIDSSELVFFLIDGTRTPSEDDRALAAGLHSHPGTVFALLTKSDTGSEPDAEARSLWEGFPHRECISALTGEGIDRLAAAVAELYLDGALDIGNDPIVGSARQYDALRRASGALDDAAAALDDGFPPDVAGTCMEDAATALSELDGRGAGAVSADVIDGIFAKFCVGK